VSSELPTAAADLEAFFKAQCPSAWRVVNAETLGTTKTAGVVLSYEQLDLSQEALGQQLPEGVLWVTFQLVLSVPETNAVKAMLRLTGEAATLIRILDASPDLKWGPDATRTRLETGETAFVIPLALLTTNPEPTPAPEEE
jgi:hypothetical protein